jgi:hypothetical protein
MRGGFACRAPYALGPSIPSDGRPSILCHSIAIPFKYRNINLSSIDYAWRPRLRIRLTLGGRTFPRKPWAFGEQDSHLFCRYSCLHGHLCEVHRSLRNGFKPRTALSYHSSKDESAASVPNLVPIIFGAKSLDQ